MPAAHRHGDARNCGATTTVIGQGSVYVNSKLWAVDADPNTHGNGGLIPSGSTVYVENKLVIVHSPDSAAADNFPHVNPATAAGSPNVFAYGGGGPGPVEQWIQDGWYQEATTQTWIQEEFLQDGFQQTIPNKGFVQ